MIWCSATGCTVRKNANVSAAPARNSAKIGVPSASSVTGRTASVQIMRRPGAGARASSAMSLASSSALAIVVPPNPTTSAKCGIAIGSSSAMLVCPIAATRMTKDQQYTVA